MSIYAVLTEAIRYYLNGLKTFNFNGRARRYEFWSFMLASYLVNHALRILSKQLGWILEFPTDTAGPEASGTVTALGLI